MARAIRNSRVNPQKIDADDALNMAEYRGQDLVQMRKNPTVADKDRSQGDTLRKKTSE
jgi:hypothetical protein